MNARDFHDSRQIRSGISDGMVTMLEDQADVLPDGEDARDVVTEVFPDHWFYQELGHHHQHSSAEQMERGVLGSLPEGHAVWVRVVEVRRDRERGGVAGERQVRRVEGDGAQVDEGDAKVGDYAQQALRERAIQDEKIHLLGEQRPRFLSRVENVADLQEL